MNMFKVAICGLILSGFSMQLSAVDFKKANNTDNLNLGSSWVGGNAPGAGDVAVWDSEVSGANSAALGAAVTLDGLRVASPGGLITISGGDALTLDGGAGTDIDMTAASQNLMLEAPLTLAGILTVDVLTGRVVTFDNDVNAGSQRFIKRGWGTVVIRDAFDVNSTDSEAFCAYNGSVILDGTESAVNLNNRFFFGRTSTASDAALIVSNGIHNADGSDSGAMANFIGVSNGRGDLFMEGGSLSCQYLRLACNTGQGFTKTNNLIVNGGVFDVTGITGGAVDSKAFTMGANHLNNSANPATQSARVEVNGGLFAVTNGTFQISGYWAGGTGWQGLFLNGGTLAVKRLDVATAPNVPKEINFNGGLLQIVNAAADGELINGSVNLTCRIQSGGALIDSGTMDMTLSQDLIEDPASTGGGLFKSGGGRLTLSGDSTYTGQTVVSNGILLITGSLSVTNLVVEPGGSFSMADGVISDFAPAAFEAGGSLTASGLELEFAADGSDNDCIVLPSGAHLYKVGVKMLRVGTADTFYKIGSYPIFKFSGLPPVIGGFFWDGAVSGYKCEFSVNSASGTVVAEISYDDTEIDSFWTATGGGSWATAVNWSAAPVSGAEASVGFGSSITANSTVSLNSAFTLGEILFSSPFAYTLDGSGSFIFDNSSADAIITVRDSQQSIDLPVAINSPLNLNVVSGSTLTFGAAISGSDVVTLTGAGDVVLESAGTSSGGFIAESGRLVVKVSDALGSGTTTLAGGSLRLDGGGSISLANPLEFSAVDNYIAVVSPTEISSALGFSSSVDRLNKDGSATLTLSGSTISSVADLQLRIRNGWVKFDDGSSFLINNLKRDAIDLSYGTNNPRGFTVESGAVVQVGGIYTGAGPSNTIHVNGGTLTLSGSSTEVGLLQTVNDENGTDRIIIDSGLFTAADDKYLSVGVRGGDVEIIVNGGLAHFGRLTLGVRADSAYSSGPLSNARIYVNGGEMEVVGFFNWMGDINSSRVNELHLNGGILRLPATMYTSSNINQSYFVLNGGSLVLTGLPLEAHGSPTLSDYLKGVTDLEAGTGGAVIDTAGVDAVITQALVPRGASTGGLIKRGAGTLTFTNICSYTGATVVEQGTLAVGGLSATSGLTVFTNAALSLANNLFDDIALTTLNLGDNARIELETSSDSAASDQISIPAGAVVGDIVIALYDKGTRDSASNDEAFAIFAYSGTPPDVSGWSLADDIFGVACTFVTNTANSTIDAVLSYTSSEVIWDKSGSGDWSTTANWRPLAPSALDAVVLFGDSLISNSVINIGSSVSVEGMMFNHSYSYTLQGSAVTLNNSTGDAFIEVAGGSHQISSDLTMNDTTTVEVVDGAELLLPGQTSGSGSLTVAGGGTLSVSGTNSVATTVRDSSTLILSAADGLSGNSLTLDGGVLQVELSETFAGAITLGAAGGSLASIDGETLTINQDLTGSGSLTKSGGGTVAVGSGVLKYQGVTTSAGGTLKLTDLPAGDLVLGGATLDLQSFNGSGTNDVVIDSGSRGAVFSIDGSLVISGSVSNVSGALLKYGSGTLTFAGSGLNDFGINTAGNIFGVAAPAANGDGPTAGYASLNVGSGKIVLGASGQTNRIGKLHVGLQSTTNASAETAGELEVVDGVTLCEEWCTIGRGNGNTITAPFGLSSRLKVSGGALTMQALTLGNPTHFSGYTGRPVLEVSGGTCTVQKQFYVNELVGGVSTVLVNGGTLIHAGVDSNSIRLGQIKGTGLLRITSGLADMQGMILAMGGTGCTGKVDLVGGVLKCYALSKRNTNEGYASLRMDGGTLKPIGGAIFNLDKFEVGTNPAVFDISLVNEYALSQPLTGEGATDGGIVLVGSNTLRISSAMAYTGPTIISNGTLKVVAALPVVSDVTVAPGGSLNAADRTGGLLTVATLTLGASGDSASAGVVLGVTADGSANDMITSTGALTLYKAAFTLYIDGSLENMFVDGTYNLISYSGADPSVSGLSVANPRYGKAYTFAASGGVLRVTVGSASSGAHLWTASGGGGWDTAANWQVAPGAGGAGTEVRFDSSITAASIVNLTQPVMLGGIHLNSLNRYTISGTPAITLDSSSGNNALIAVELGAHTVTAPVVLNETLEVKAITGTELDLAGDISGNASLIKDNSGTLILSGQNSYTGATDVVSGMLKLGDGATLGDGDLLLSDFGSIIGISLGSSVVLDNNVQMNDARGYFITTGDLELSGALNWNVPGTLYKSGDGVLALSGSATATNESHYIQTGEGTLTFAAGSEYHLNYNQREAFNQTVNNSEYRKIIFENGSYVKAGGMYFQWGKENRIEVDGVLELVDDKDSVCLRTLTASQNYIDYFTVMNNGYLTTRSSSWFNVGVRGTSFFDVDGGVANVGRLTLGYELGFALNGKAGHAVTRNGGLLNVQGELNWMGDTYVRRCNSLTINSGSRIMFPATRVIHTTGWTAFGLNGGTFEATGAGIYGGVVTDYLAGLDILHIGTEGCTIDTDIDVTIAQSVASEGSTNAVIFKSGSGRLTLSQPLAWAGGINVMDGTLVAELTSDEGVADPTNIFYRANFEFGPNQDTSGNARHGIMDGSEINLGSTGPQSDNALVYNGNTILRVPYADEMNNVNQYTVAGWVWVDAYTSTYQAHTIFTTRIADNDLRQTMLRVLQDGRLRFVATGSNAGWNDGFSVGTVPLGEWTHIAMVVNGNTVKFYLNGAFDNSFSITGENFYLSPDRRGTEAYGMAFGGFKIYETSNMFKGRLDDMRLYTRMLDVTEIAEISGSVEKYPDLCVSSGGTFSAQGSSQVNVLSGEGFVDGELTVLGAVAPGDSTSTAAGATLSVDTLNLTSNTVYDCTWSASYSDVVVVNDLKIAGAGAVDLGRDSGNPIPDGYFRTVLMYYDTISGEANLDNWTVVNAGVGGGALETSIFAVDGEVVLTMKNLRGTVIIIR